MSNNQFNVNDYTKSNIWKGNKYLVQPTSTVKCCENCNRSWYSIEFAESELFADHKYPICNKCSRKSKNQAKIAKLVAKYNVLQTCTKCKNDRPINEFISRKSDWIIVNTICDSCRKMPVVAYSD